MDCNSICELCRNVIHHVIFWRILLFDHPYCNSSKFNPTDQRPKSNLIFLQVYISEIAVRDIRGVLSALQKIIGHMGVLISFSVGAWLDWRQLAAIVCLAPLLLCFGALYVPESPSYLALCGRDSEAARSLQWLRGPHADIRLELATIRTNVLASRQVRFRTLFSRA